MVANGRCRDSVRHERQPDGRHIPCSCHVDAVNLHVDVACHLNGPVFVCHHDVSLLNKIKTRDIGQLADLCKDCVDNQVGFFR